MNEVSEVWREAYQDAHPSMSEEELCVQYDNMIRNILPKADGYVCVRKGVILGFITFGTGRPCHVDNLYVKSEFQDQGIGT